MEFRSWVRVATQPWRELPVLLALVGALALPALLLASAPMFRTAASDEIGQQVTARFEANQLGVVIQAQGPLGGDALDELDRRIEDRLVAVDELGAPLRTRLSTELAVTAVDGSAVEVPPGPGDVRVLSRPGAAAAVTIVDGVAEGGVLVPASLASDHALAPGSTIAVGAGEVVVAGVYRDVWDDETFENYWSELPRDMVPRFLRAFDQPDFEMVIADEAVVASLELFGRSRWEAAVEERPGTWDATTTLAGRYRALESAFVGEGSLAATHEAWAADPAVLPLFVSALEPAIADARVLIDELEAPIRTASLAGTAGGVLLSTIGAVFLVRRRRNDLRVLAADGDAWWRFFGRAVAQYAGPAVVAIAVGVGAGWVIVRLLGPSGTATLTVVPWWSVIAVTAVSMVLAAGVTSLMSVRLADWTRPAPTVRWGWVFVLAAVAVTMWVQVQRERDDVVNPLIVAFPFVGTVAGVVLAVVAIGAVLPRLRGTGRRLPMPLFLAWRALGGSRSGALALAAALGLASGLTVLSVSFVDTIDIATDAKASTVVGAASRLDTADLDDRSILPAESTVVLSSSARVGDTSVAVLAVDPDTYAQVVAWPEQFGGDASSMIDALGADAATEVPAIVVGGPLPERGAFGFTRTFPYRIVGEQASVPLASTFDPTLVVRADVLEAFARGRWNRGEEPIDPVDRHIAETLGREIDYESPLTSFSESILSTAPLETLEELAAEQRWRVNDAASLDRYRADVDTQTTRWAFDYLGLLALIAATVALGALGFYLSERRRDRAVTTVMLRQIGISPRTLVSAGVAELIALVSLAIAAGATAASITAGEVFTVFEPDPDIPPTIQLVIDVARIGSIYAVVLLAVAGIAAQSQMRALRADPGSVLRG